nr:probable ATP-dependent RNA helicase ddx56 [Crassostrea gigas]|eukprot:XP_011454640.1 PREDICTED: probable ATP-dependent RNA helicase ddx56 [Crassostrea gigas]
MEKGAECGRRQRADGRWSTEANYGSVESRVGSWSFSDSENGVSDTLTVGPREDKGHQDSLASPPEEWYRPTMSDVLGNCEANDQTNGTVENYDDNVDENDDENNDENNDEIYNENDEFSVEKDEEASLEEENIEDDLINEDDIMTTMNNKRNQDKSEPCYDVDQVIECE